MINDYRRKGITIDSKVYGLPMDLKLPQGKDWVQYSIFKGITKILGGLSCHVSVLRNNSTPHTPHGHEEEELLILLSGKARLILPSLIQPGQRTLELKEKQFVYYPPCFPHTIQAISRKPAVYLMFKWKTGQKNKNPQLDFAHYDTAVIPEHTGTGIGLSTVSLFKGPTCYLKNLGCHISSMPPGMGYKPHRDDHDVSMILLEGRLETLGQKVKPCDVIFYSAGEPHGLVNPGKNTARYLVFEFYGDSLKSFSGFKNLFAYIFERITDPGFWKRRIKKLLFKKSG